jgi:hypothetical protein
MGTSLLCFSIPAITLSRHSPQVRGTIGVVQLRPLNRHLLPFDSPTNLRGVDRTRIHLQ